MKTRRPRPTAYQKIMRASIRDTGVRLTPWDVRELARDHAIFSVAQDDDRAAELLKAKKRAKATA